MSNDRLTKHALNHPQWWLELRTNSHLTWFSLLWWAAVTGFLWWRVDVETTHPVLACVVLWLAFVGAYGVWLLAARTVAAFMVRCARTAPPQPLPRVHIGGVADLLADPRWREGVDATPACASCTAIGPEDRPYECPDNCGGSQ